MAISADGTRVAFIAGRGGLRRVYLRRFAEFDAIPLRGSDPQPRPVVRTSGYDGGAQFSPDGRWMANVTNESGQFDVDGRPYPGPDRKVQVMVKDDSSSGRLNIVLNWFEELKRLAPTN